MLFAHIEHQFQYPNKKKNCWSHSVPHLGSHSHLHHGVAHHDGGSAGEESPHPSLHHRPAHIGFGDFIVNVVVKRRSVHVVFV